MLRLSQGQLNMLETCPRKFQHVYLDHLGSPTTPEQQERLTWGSQFHLLMQQREMGLPIAPLTTDDQALHQCVEAFIAATPEVFQDNASTWRQSEHRCTLEFEGYLLTVVYDLLVLDDRHAQIFDWKTYPRPQNPTRLKQNWQTRLYLFVLAETSSYSPEQISMTYWFIRSQSQEGQPPERLRFEYSAEQYQRDRQALTYLLHQLSDWMEQYQVGTPLPQVDRASRYCESCHFAARCDRIATDPAYQPVAVPDLTDIQEVSL